MTCTPRTTHTCLKPVNASSYSSRSRKYTAVRAVPRSKLRARAPMCDLCVAVLTCMEGAGAEVLSARQPYTSIDSGTPCAAGLRNHTALSPCGPPKNKKKSQNVCGITAIHNLINIQFGVNSKLHQGGELGAIHDNRLSAQAL
jgi:hypothetical protein